MFIKYMQEEKERLMDGDFSMVFRRERAAFAFDKKS